MGDHAPAPAIGVAAMQPPKASDVCRTALIIDGAYAQIGAKKLPGGRIDYVKFREELERQAACRFRESWFFDHEPTRRSANQENSTWYTNLKLAPPHGPQFQLKLYGMKKYACHCRRCGHEFTQNVQKGVDNGIATKILSLAYENVCDRFILFAGDGDFYDSLNLIKNVLRKDLWVIGYRNTVSADLQQLAAHVIWMDDIWPNVQAAVPQATAPLAPGFRPPSTETSPLTDSPNIESDRPVQTQNTRRIQLDRHASDGDLVDENSRRKTRTRRRKEECNMRRSRQPPRSESTYPPQEDIQLGDGGHPPFFIDTGGDAGASRQTNRPLARAMDSTRAPRADTQQRGRRAKRKRGSPPPTLTFELSDLSSEEDEQHPLLPVATRGSQPPNNEVIDLASDSE